MVKGLVKQDINFCEHPIWFQNPEQSEGLIWKDREGYTYRAGYKAPTKTDIIFLYYLMLYSQKHEWTDKLTLSQRSILKGCGIEPGKRWADRLKDSLTRWKNISLEFQGTFYNGKEYIFLNFGIIDDWGIDKETRHIQIRFAPKWLLKIKESNFFKYLDFEQIKALRSAVAIRLYEILIKSFQGRDVWEIDALKLAAKIPMAEKYVSDIIPKTKAAVNRINDKTSLKLTLKVRRPKRGQAIFAFQKKEALDDKRDVLNDSASEDYRDLLSLLPKQYQIKKTIQEMITRYLHRYGSEYVRRNVLYTNDQVRDPKKYRVYFAKALKGDWGLAWQEDEKQAELDRQEKEQVKTKAETEQKAIQNKIQKDKQRNWDSLSIPEQETWIEKVRKQWNLSGDLLKVAAVERAFKKVRIESRSQQTN